MNRRLTAPEVLALMRDKREASTPSASLNPASAIASPASNNQWLAIGIGVTVLIAGSFWAAWWLDQQEQKRQQAQRKKASSKPLKAPDRSEDELGRNLSYFAVPHCAAHNKPMFHQAVPISTTDGTRDRI